MAEIGVAISESRPDAQQVKLMLPERIANRIQLIYMLLYVMPQSLSHLIVHAVFSTKDRRPLLRSEEIRTETYAFMAGILKKFVSL